MSTDNVAVLASIHAKSLYIAINERDGYYDVAQHLPEMAREKSKIIYFPEAQHEEGLIFEGDRMSDEETYFIAAYSGEVLSTRAILLNDALRKDEKLHTHTIALVNEGENDTNNNNISSSENELSLTPTPPSSSSSSVNTFENESPQRYWSREWILSGWNEVGQKDLAIFTNHQITVMLTRYAFDSPVLLQRLGLEPLTFQGKIQSDKLRLLMERLGTAAIVLYKVGATVGKSIVAWIEKLEEQQNQAGRKKRFPLEVYSYRDYEMTINYPANATLARMLLDRTYLFSNGTVVEQESEETTLNNIVVLGANAENNRLAHWRGSPACRLTYIERLPKAQILHGHEICIVYGREYEERERSGHVYNPKKRVQYYPDNIRYVQRFSHPPRSQLPEEWKNALHDHFLMHQETPIDSQQLANILYELVPLVMLLNNIERESLFMADYIVNRFSAKYMQFYVLVRDPQMRRKRLFVLIVTTLLIALPDEATPEWLRNATEINYSLDDADSVVIRFIELIDQLSIYFEASQLDKLSKLLYQSAFIHLLPETKALTAVKKLFYQLRIRRSERSRALLYNHSLPVAEGEEDLLSMSRLIRSYYLIPILGTTNILYRDTLYYMSHAETEAEGRFEPSLTGYKKLRFFDGTLEGWRRLVHPVLFLVGQLLLRTGHKRMEPVLSSNLYSNNLKGLKMELIYFMSQFIEEKKLGLFVDVINIYLRLYTLCRLLPVLQLEEQWLHALYIRYRTLFLQMCGYFVENRDTIQRTLSLSVPTINYQGYRKRKAELLAWMSTQEQVTPDSLLQRLQ